METGEACLGRSSRSNPAGEMRVTTATRCAHVEGKGPEPQILSKAKNVEHAKTVPDPTASTTTISPRTVAVDTRVPEVPQLSDSVGSVTSNESQSPSKDLQSHPKESYPSPKLLNKTTTLVRGFSIPQCHGHESTKPLQSAIAKKDARFTLGCSSEGEGSDKKSRLSAQAAGPTKQHKQVLFSSHATMYNPDEPGNAIESDSDDYIDESAIDDDDDSSDWEDSIEDSGKSSVDDKYFQRVDSDANLTSRRSLITLMLAQSDDRARTLGRYASRSTSAIPQTHNNCQGPSLGGSPNDSDDAPLLMEAEQEPKVIGGISQSSEPIAVPSPMNIQGGFSPRTTRRHMLSTELTESLRRHLLWERQQKSATANAVLKRRHTSHDVANLKQFPEKPCIKQSEDVNFSGNQYLSKDTFGGYHATEW